MNKAKTTIDIAKECGADFEHANSEIVTSYASDVLIFSTNAIETFRKACEADYKSRCVKHESDYSINVELYALPNDGE